MIPVLNSAPTLPIVVEQIQAGLTTVNLPFELILVNDDSTDESWTAIERLAAEHQWISGICLTRNYGQHNALLAGLRHARYEIVVTMDDDLQNPPSELPKLLDALTDRFDVVYGTPTHEQHGLFRDLASAITKLALTSAMGAAIASQTSAFRVFRTSLRNSFATYRSPSVSIDVLLTWSTTRFTSVAVEHKPRLAGESNYTFRRLVRHALNMMTGFSVLPLQFASVVGFTFTLFGIGVLSYVLANYFVNGTSVAGFPFLASIIAIFSGAQLFALGIIGEYLARMHFRMMDKPPYAIRRRIGGGD